MDGPHLVRVAAVLMRAPALPAGDIGQTLAFIAGLTPDGRLDEQSYRETADYWRAEGSVPGAPAVIGRIVMDREWGLRPGPGEEDPIWRLTAHSVRPGEYITLFRPDGAELVFRVVNVGEPTD
jgi:hypothetical protein